MGTMFSSSARITAALTTTKEVFSFTAASSTVCWIHEIHLTADETTSEGVEFKISRFTTAGSVGGAAGTASPLQDIGEPAGATVYFGATTVATGSEVVLWRQAENVLNGIHYVPTPECRIMVPPSGKIAMQAVSTTTATNWVCSFIWETLG